MVPEHTHFQAPLLDLRMSSNNKVISSKGIRRRIILYTSHILRRRKPGRQNRLDQRHRRFSREWRKGITRHGHLLLVSESRYRDCTLRRHSDQAFDAVESAPEIEGVQIERLDCGAGIQYREGWGPV